MSRAPCASSRCYPSPSGGPQRSTCCRRAVCRRRHRGWLVFVLADAIAGAGRARRSNSQFPKDGPSFQRWALGFQKPHGGARRLSRGLRVPLVQLSAGAERVAVRAVGCDLALRSSVAGAVSASSSFKFLRLSLSLSSLSTADEEGKLGRVGVDGYEERREQTKEHPTRDELIRFPYHDCIKKTCDNYHVLKPKRRHSTHTKRGKEKKREKKRPDRTQRSSAASPSLQYTSFCRNESRNCATDGSLGGGRIEYSVQASGRDRIQAR